MVKEKPQVNTIIINKVARYNYTIENTYEAGMVLQGWEVKAARAKKVQLTDGYVLIRSGELYIIGSHFAPLQTASTHLVPEIGRIRKLLLHKDEIRRLIGRVAQKGYTLVPLNLHWKCGKIKCDLGLAKGKNVHDKRQSIKEREYNRDLQRVRKFFNNR
ncbi:MAG: SsrA-binding protein SmpB [Gammaproteobacteria bacterium]|nr:SsrA-binding protein SmpB [Gammaproteobacteria bacterium]